LKKKLLKKENEELRNLIAVLHNGLFLIKRITEDVDKINAIATNTFSDYYDLLRHYCNVEGLDDTGID
jgi:hypothetical protein